MTLDTHSTVSDVTESLHTVLTQSSGDQFDEINHLVDLIVDSGALSYSKIAHLCLMPKQERNELLMGLTTNFNRSQGKVDLYSYVRISHTKCHIIFRLSL